MGALGAALAAAGLRMMFEHKPTETAPHQAPPAWLAALIGAALGFLSGLVGIGGGIFLAPILYMLRWDTPHAIAGAASLFILVNSISGLGGQIAKIGDLALMGEFSGLLAAFSRCPDRRTNWFTFGISGSLRTAFAALNRYTCALCGLASAATMGRPVIFLGIAV